MTYGGDDACVLFVGEDIQTVEQLLDSAQIDSRIWEVVEVSTNSWQVAGKRKLGQYADGRNQPEQLWKTGLKQIRIKLRRKAPKSIQEGIESLIADMPKLPKCKPRKPAKGKHLLEASIYDAHFGKLCYHREVGENFDLRSASEDYAGAIEDMLARTVGFPIEKIVIPLGNDLFNVDNWQGTTAKGTVIESTDDRFTKVFRTVFQVLRDAALRCLEVAPVELLWVPGNHDPATSWYLCEAFRHYFENEKHLRVDNSERTRKYIAYGVNLIGWHHGDQVSLDKLAALMPVEVPDLWSKSTYRFIRCGHFHKAKQIRHLNRDTSYGVDVRVIPSLSVVDRWHWDQGYIGNIRAAECAVWNRDTGHVADFTIEARSAVAARKAKVQ